jgi:hypothetical protein
MSRAWSGASASWACAAAAGSRARRGKTRGPPPIDCTKRGKCTPGGPNRHKPAPAPRRRNSSPRVSWTITKAEITLRRERSLTAPPFGSSTRSPGARVGGAPLFLVGHPGARPMASPAPRRPWPRLHRRARPLPRDDRRRDLRATRCREAPIRRGSSFSSQGDRWWISVPVPPIWIDPTTPDHSGG